MIKASSLFYAIVISLIIAIVSSSLILFSYLSSIQFDNLETEQRLNRNTNSGLNLLLSNQTLVEYDQPKILDLFDNAIDSVELIKKHWGAFDIISSKAFFKNKQVFRIAQTGTTLDTINPFSIYMVDEDKQLAVCGRTIIKGTAYLPKSGIKRAYIEGQNFIGKVLVDGVIKESKKELPAFNDDLIKMIKYFFEKKITSNNDSIAIINGEEDSIVNSFNNKTLVYESRSRIVMKQGYYSGNILIFSDSLILINNNVAMQDVIVCAPKVVIKEGFRGTLQVFASDSIVIEKNVDLGYPSVIGLLVTKKSSIVPTIIIGENDSINGSVFAYQNVNDFLKPARVICSIKSFIYGQVYTNCTLSFMGEINGSLMCRKILLTTPSSVYENHLLNAIIDRSKLPNYFVGGNLFKEKGQKNIIKWLN